MSTKNIRYKEIIGIIGLLISALFLIYFPDIISFITKFLEKNFSADHQLSTSHKDEIKAYLAFVIFLWIFCCLIIIFELHNKLMKHSSSIISLDGASVFFTIDPLCMNNRHTRFILWAGPILGLLSYFYYLISGIEENEGMIESISQFVFLFSGILLIISSMKIKNLTLPNEARTRLLIALAVISMLILVIFGEEISWGQQIFHWKSSEVFVKYNFQNETNIHNFFNPLYKFVYPIAGMSLFVILFFLWFFPQKKSDYLFNLLIPHQSLFFLVALFTCTTFLKYREISEQLLADFCFLYSFRIYMCLRFPTISIEKESSYIV
jgi:hypothetical protein